MAKFKPIQATIYTSSTCAHSRAVENLMAKNDINVRIVNIDNNTSARKKVMEINDGFASVPTIVFPDGEVMTEPSLRSLRAKFGIQGPNIIKHLKDIFSN